ncbi:hypothetical protein VNI00_019468 [Paramarasmius palmivorus]|uniref:Uncharacterized protein n=1 Tax=Paramarasmius palmivorus TaxID=297713 RepID=A0AAW0AKA9_9AGAR
MVDLKGFNKDTGRYDVRPPAKKRPKNPLRTNYGTKTEPVTDSDADDSKTLTPSQASRKANREEKRLLHKLIFSDQRDLVSGSPKAMVQAAHWLNALRSKHGNSEQKKAYKQLKAAIEELLTTLKFCGDIPFQLDGRPNLGLLSVEDRYALDTYGLIAVGLDLPDLVVMSAYLKIDNEVWDKNPEGERTLTPAAYDSDKQRWRLIVLYPNEYLPANAPHMILDPNKRTYRKTNQDSPPDPDRSDWISCTVDSALLLQRSDTEVALRLAVEGNREKNDFPSTFAIICNFASKVQAVEDTTYLTAPQAAILSTYKEWLKKLVDLIYYTPPSRTRTIYAKVDAAVQAVEDAAPQVKRSRPSPESGDRTPTNEPFITGAQSSPVDQATNLNKESGDEDMEKDVTFSPEKQRASDASQETFSKSQPEPNSPPGQSASTSVIDWRNGISSTKPEDIELPVQEPDTHVDDLGYTLAERAAIGKQIVNATNPTERAQAWQRMFFGPLGHPNYQRPPRYDDCEQWEYDSDESDDSDESCDDVMSQSASN